MNNHISVCSILLITVKLNAVLPSIHAASLSSNMQLDSMSHVINKRSPEVVSAKKGCIDGCVSAEHQKSKISEIEPDAKDAKDEADQDKSVSHTTTVQLLLEKNLKTVVEKEVVNKNKSNNKNRNGPCAIAAAFIESLLSSQESKDSKESILEELYEYYDQLKNSSTSGDGQYEIVIEEVSKSKNNTVPKESDLESLYRVVNESLKVVGPGDLPLSTESESEELSSVSSVERTTDSSGSGEDFFSSEHSLSTESNSHSLHRIKTTYVTESRRVSKLLPTTTEISSSSQDQTDSSTTESLPGANDSNTIGNPSVTETPLRVDAHVSVTLKEKSKSPNNSNGSSLTKETKILKQFHIPGDDSDSSSKNITEVGSSADIEIVTEEKSNTTDKNVAVVDISVTLTESEVSRNDSNSKPKETVTDAEDEESLQTRKTTKPPFLNSTNPLASSDGTERPKEIVTDTEEEESPQTRKTTKPPFLNSTNPLASSDITEKPYERVTDVGEESLKTTETTTPPFLNSPTPKFVLDRREEPQESVTDVEKESSQTIKITRPPLLKSTTPTNRLNEKEIKLKINEAKDKACINRLSLKYPFLKLLLSKNVTNVVQSPTVLVPIPIEYILSSPLTHIDVSHLPSSSLESKQKSCKRLRVLIAKILEALSKLDVPVEHLIKATRSKDAKRQARDIRQKLIAHISDLSTEDLEN